MSSSASISCTSTNNESDGDAITTQITQDILNDHIDDASQRYMKHLQKLSIKNKEAISILVYYACDPSVIPYCFPDLHEDDVTMNSPETTTLKQSSSTSTTYTSTVSSYAPVPEVAVASSSWNSNNDTIALKQLGVVIHSSTTTATAAASSSSTTAATSLIIQLISQQNLDEASEIWKENVTYLSQDDKNIISTTLYQLYDIELIEFFFPYLHNNDNNGIDNNKAATAMVEEGYNDVDVDVDVDDDDDYYGYKNHHTQDANDMTKRKLDDILKDDSYAHYDHSCYKIQGNDVVKEQYDTIHRIFLSFCESDSLTNFASYWGLTQPTFSKNPYAVKGNIVYDRFMNSIKLLQSDSTTTLQIVFHGTRTLNITPILKDGLDPKKRKGQAYGPGEYFGTHPSISVSYCHGDLMMLIFAVIVPDHKKKKEGTPYHHCPSEYMVVPNNEHQIPLGTLTFSGCDAKKLEMSQKLKSQLSALSFDVAEKIRNAEMGMIRAKIIQEIIMGNILIASEKYIQYQNSLSYNDKREISMYLRSLHDPEVIGFYFIDLPEPMTKEEHNQGLQNADDMVSTAIEAKKKLNAERTRLGIGS